MLEQGKKVRCKGWDKDGYIYLCDRVVCSETRNALLGLETFATEEWEEYIEGKDINAATKIKELDYVINDAYGNEVYDITTLKSHARKNRDKINEIIKYINSKEE